MPVVAAVGRCSEVYNLAADMGGMGFIENNKAAVHALGADQHAPAPGGPSSTASSASSSPRPRACTPSRQAGRRARTPAEGGRRLPGHARGRLRLGEAVQRADVPALPRGLRPARPGSRATTTSTARTAPGDGGREKAPAAICRKVAEAKLHRQPRDRDLGRRRADAQLHVHRRLRHGHADDHGSPTSSSRSTSAAASWSRSTSWSTSSRTIAGVDARAPLRPRRAQGRAGPQQRQHADPASSSAGSRASRCARASSAPTRWIERAARCARRRRRRLSPATLAVSSLSVASKRAAKPVDGKCSRGDTRVRPRRGAAISSASPAISATFAGNASGFELSTTQPAPASLDDPRHLAGRVHGGEHRQPVGHEVHQLRGDVELGALVVLA